MKEQLTQPGDDILLTLCEQFLDGLYVSEKGNVVEEA